MMNDKPLANPDMTLRDYFAGQVLAGLVTQRPYNIKGDVALAYEYANAMLEERQKHVSYD